MRRHWSVSPARAAALATALAAALAGAAPGSAEEADAKPAAVLRIAVHPSRPPLSVELFAGDDGVSARVLEEPSARVVQEIPAAEVEPAAIPAAWVQDLSFDGYLDLALPSFTGATGNVGWAVWLFAPEKGVFERNALLSEASQLAVDPARQELTSRWNAGHAGALYTLDTFRCPGGVPTLVRRERVDLEQGSHVRTVEELRDGKLVQVERSVEP